MATAIRSEEFAHAQHGAFGDDVEPDLLWRALDALSVGFAVFDDELRFAACNRAFQELRGYPEDLCRPGVAFADFIAFNARRGDYGDGPVDNHVAIRLERAKSRKRQHLEYELAAGRVLRIEYRPLDPHGLLISYIDVTQRRRAEEALKVSNERYALAMAGANEGLWDWDAATDKVVVSPAYKERIGLDLEHEAIPLDDWITRIHPDDLDRREQARNAHLAGEKEFFDCEYRVRCADGDYHWFRDRARAQRDKTGRVIRMSGAVIDVTERRKAQQELIEAHERIKLKNEMLSSLSSRLAKYLSPQIYNSIFTGKQSVELSSKRKKLTVFFCDIVEFTRITGHLEAEQLTAVLNRYLSTLSDIAIAHGGTIDKYVGDAIMGFFGDPESLGDKEDAVACVEMALAMQRKMVELRECWRDEGIDEPIRIRIGITTGYCTVGNFGSEQRMEYTIVGNQVNLAARLQAAAEPGGILVAHETFSLVKDRFGFEECPPLPMKGMAQPVKCYSVIGRLDALKAGGRMIREYGDGTRIFLDLDRGDRDDQIRTVQAVLDKLKEG